MAGFSSNFFQCGSRPGKGVGRLSAIIRQLFGRLLNIPPSLFERISFRNWGLWSLDCPSLYSPSSKVVKQVGLRETGPVSYALALSMSGNLDLLLSFIHNPETKTAPNVFWNQLWSEITMSQIILASTDIYVVLMLWGSLLFLFIASSQVIFLSFVLTSDSFVLSDNVAIGMTLMNSLQFYSYSNVVFFKKKYGHS